MVMQKQMRGRRDKTRKYPRIQINYQNERHNGLNKSTVKHTFVKFQSNWNIILVQQLVLEYIHIKIERTNIEHTSREKR